MEEVRWYVSIILISILVITANTASMFSSVKLAFHHVAFTVASIITTTGFGTVDFNEFPVLSKTILVMLMFCGACAGSTGGGFKVSRIIILIKHSYYQLYKSIHPRTIKTIKMDKKPISSDVVSGAHAYLTIYIIVLIISCILIGIDNFDMTTSVTAVIACLNNIGPGLEMVGTTGNYSEFSNFSKMLLSFNMLIGRLEIFPILTLLMPTMWRKRI